MTDDYASSISTTGSVVMGGSVTGEIEFWGDRDWFAVTLEAGKTYRFDPGRLAHERRHPGRPVSARDL